MKPEPLSRGLSDVTWLGLSGRLSAAVAVAFGLYAATIAYLIKPYIHQGSDAGRVVGVYEGYQRVAEQMDHSRKLVLFWGSSMVREGVDCRLVEASCPQLAAYNFSVSGDIPYRRLVELPRVTHLHPDCVVIGVSYPEVFESRPPFEDQVAVLPASAYRAMPADARSLLEARVTAIAGRSEWERFWWQRKFFFPALCWRLGVKDRSDPIPAGYTDNLKAPFVYTKTIRSVELKRYLDSRAGSYPPYTGSEVAAPAESLSGRSLRLIVSELKSQGIRVKLVNMPLNPLLDTAIAASRHTALQEFLKSLAAPMVQVFDYQDAIPAECFIDLVHMNEKGRAAFTSMMAEQLEAGQRPVVAQTNRKGPYEL